MWKELSFILVLVGTSCGFLLDDKIQRQTTTKPTFSDEHFAIMLNLLTEEKQSRIKLEKRVMQLESELLSTQKGVTDIYHTGLQHNKTLKQQTTKMESLGNTVSKLDHQYNLLLTSIGQIQLNQTLLNNLAAQITHKLDILEHSKGALDMKMVLDIRNDTIRLEAELQNANNQLSLVKNDVNARKQDFVALFNKADSTEHKLDQYVSRVEKNLTSLQNQYGLNNMSILNLEKKTEKQLSILQNDQNVTAGSLNAEITKIHNRVAVTACAREQYYSSGNFVEFPDVYFRKNISNTAVAALARNGTFICEKTGMYLVSVHIMTNSEQQYASITKNGQTVTTLWFYSQGTFDTTSVTYLEHMDIHDKINVRPSGKMYVHGYNYSCMTILQLT